MIDLDQPDYNVYVINGCGLLGRLTALELAKKIKKDIRLILIDQKKITFKDFKKEICNDKVGTYRAISLKEAIELSGKKCDVVAISEKYSEDLEEKLGIATKERLLIHCKRNLSNPKENTLKMFISKDNKLKLTELNNKEESITLYEEFYYLLPYAINILIDYVILNISSLKSYYNKDSTKNAEVHIFNLGKSKKYFEKIVKSKSKAGK
jgi:hypothetical protein